MWFYCNSTAISAMLKIYIKFFKLFIIQKNRETLIWKTNQDIISTKMGKTTVI